MKRRIKAGEYAFPENEWSRVSKEAKNLIQGMLETIPEKRSNINDIVRSTWISVISILIIIKKNNSFEISYLIILFLF